MTVLAQTAAPRAQKTDGGLYDILDLILDRGLVIDVFIRVSVIGIEVLRVDIRIVIASVDTYLRFAAATNRLDLENRGTPVVTSPVMFAPDLPTSMASGGQAAVAPSAAAALPPGGVVMQGQPVTAWPPGTGAAVPAVGGLVGSVAPAVAGVAGTVGRTPGTLVGTVVPAAAPAVSTIPPAPVTDPAVHGGDEAGAVEQMTVHEAQDVSDASDPTAAGHEQAPTTARGRTRGGKGQPGGEA